MTLDISMSLITVKPDPPFFYSATHRIHCSVCGHEGLELAFIQGGQLKDTPNAPFPKSGYLECPRCHAREEETLGIRIQNLMLYAVYRE